MKLIAFLSFILLCSPCSGQVKKIDRVANNLLGPVKSTRLVYYRGEEKFGELKKSHEEFTLTEEYNREGLLVESKLVDGSSVTKTTYRYDKNSNLVEKREDEDGEVSIFLLKYDTDGRQVELDTYKGKGKLESRLKTKYNANGNTELESLYNGDGSLKDKTSFIYDDQKQLTETKTIDANNKIIRNLMFEYDDHGRLIIELKIEDNEGEEVIVYSTTYTYNNQGRISKKEFLSSKGTDKKEELTYDTFGNVVKDFSDEKNFEVDILSYDNRNNWIKKIRTFSTSHSLRKFILEREVKYY